MKKAIPFFLLLSLLLTSCTNAIPSGDISSLLQSIRANPLTRTDSKAAEQPVLLIGIGMHIEPQGETHQGYKSGKGDFNNPDYYKMQSQNIRTVVNMINQHGGRMTIQAQSPFTDAAISKNDRILAELAAAGNEIALHFHEDAHLGKNSETLTVKQWCAVMVEEISLVKQASGVQTIRYWSGGNLYPDLFKAAQCAGLTINSDWKNPQTQSTDISLTGVNPWRPAGGTDGSSFDLLSRHDPNGPVIFLPEGQYDKENFASMRHSDNSGGDEAYFDYLEQSLMASLEAAEGGKVNVFHFTVHPGEFRGKPAHPFAVIEDFLTQVVDPLVKSGRVKWATFSEMADAYTAWEKTHPGQDMR